MGRARWQPPCLPNRPTLAQLLTQLRQAGALSAQSTAHARARQRARERQ